MRKATWLLIGTIITLSLAFSGAGAALADGGGHGHGHGGGHGHGHGGHQAQITWSPEELNLTITPGQTATAEVTLTSDQDVSGVTFGAKGDKGITVSVMPSTVDLQAGVATQVTVSVMLDASAQGGQAELMAMAGGKGLDGSLDITVNGGEGGHGHGHGHGGGHGHGH